MATVERIVKASPEHVFAVLADGWTYSDWVVGTVHMRDVDDDWPSAGSRLHHKAGPWPVSLRDSTEVLEMETDRHLRLNAGLWPFGEAIVDLRLEPAPAGTRVIMHEHFERGPLRLLRNKLNDLVLHRRNVESLSRLADIAERAHPGVV